MLVARVERPVGAKGVTSGQIALAWVLAQGKDIVPTPGTTRQHHLDEIIEAAQVTFTREELDEIDTAMPKDAVSGMRYPESGMKMVNL